MQFTDDTDRIAAERQQRRDRETLAEVSRLSVLGEMAAGIAHEVNQPLGAYLQLRPSSQDSSFRRHVDRSRGRTIF